MFETFLWFRHRQEAMHLVMSSLPTITLGTWEHQRNWQLQRNRNFQEANESKKHVRKAVGRKLRCNATVRSLTCSVFQELRCNRVAVFSV
jgi:hypothetical protein